MVCHTKEVQDSSQFIRLQATVTKKTARNIYSIKFIKACHKINKTPFHIMKQVFINFSNFEPELLVPHSA